MREQMTEAGLCCEMLPDATEITRGAFIFARLEQKSTFGAPSPALWPPNVWASNTNICLWFDVAFWCSRPLNHSDKSHLVPRIRWLTRRLSRLVGMISLGEAPPCTDQRHGV